MTIHVVDAEVGFFGGKPCRLDATIGTSLLGLFQLLGNSLAERRQSLLVRVGLRCLLLIHGLPVLSFHNRSL